MIILGRFGKIRVHGSIDLRLLSSPHAAFNPALIIRLSLIIIIAIAIAIAIASSLTIIDLVLVLVNTRADRSNQKSLHLKRYTVI
jgi:hypothetical protein